MELDLHRFRNLVPIDTLPEGNVSQLADKTNVHSYARGATVFNIGDHDTESIYLLSGELALIDQHGNQRLIRSGAPQAEYALANLKPRQFTATVVSTQATIARVDSALLEKLVTWNQMATAASGSGMEVTELDSEDALDSEWMLAMVQTKAFLRLPVGNIQSLFEQMEEVTAHAGDVIIKQGDEGDYYYMIKQGLCAVQHNGQRLAQLSPGDSFGEEALISDEPRNATVVMETDGRLMRLSKENFKQLMHAPSVKYVSLAEAGRLVREGAVRVDVRLESEYAQSAIPNTLNIPLYLVRVKGPKLDRRHKYVLYCDTGSRSSAAAFLLAQYGLDVYVLDGGLQAIPRPAEEE